MKRFFFIIIAIGMGLVIYKQQTNKHPVAVGSPYVTVYGRTSCGYTKQMTNYLQSKNIPYSFLSVDDNKTANTLHERMRAQGLNTRSYYLPVVDVSGQLAIRPDPKSVDTAYKK